MKKYGLLRRGLSMLLCLCVVISSAGTVAFATDPGLPSPEGGEPVVLSGDSSCNRTEGCTLPGGHEGECVLPPEEEPGPCGLTEGCTLSAGHEGECVLPPEEEPGPCGLTEGCTLPAGHEGECVLTVTEDPQQAPFNQSSGPCRVGDVFYSDFNEALGDLKDGEVLEILEDVEWNSSYCRLPEGSVTVTSAKEDGTKATITMGNSFGLYSYSDATITFKNINIDCNENTLQVSTGATVILDNGTTVTNGGTHYGALAPFYSQAGTVVMKDGALITESQLGVTVDSGLTFRMEGGQITGNQHSYLYAAGIVYDEGTLVISGNAQVTGNTVDDGSGNYINGNVYIGSSVPMDLTGLSEGAQIGITVDPDSKPTADAPIKLAAISGSEIPSGVTLDNAVNDDAYPYALQAGQKLDAGALYLTDPNSEPSVELRGSGTANDPFRVSTCEELYAAVNKLNTRSAMSYVMVENDIVFPKEIPDRLFLSGKMTLYGKDPSVQLSAYNAMFYLKGTSFELVLRDITIVPEPDATKYVAVTGTYGPGERDGLITIEPGTTLKQMIVTASDGDIVVNGGVFDGRSVGGASVTVNGGIFKNNTSSYVLESDYKNQLCISGDVVFENNIVDVYADPSDLPVKITSPLQNQIVLNASVTSTKPVLVADDASYLKGWESYIKPGSPDLSFRLSEDGKSLYVANTDRQKISFVDAQYEPAGTYYNAGTDQRRGGFYSNGIAPLKYNGLGVKAEFTKVQMKGSDGNPLANFEDSAGVQMTDEKGYITNWNSVDLEYYAVTRDGKRIEGANGVVDNIPGNVSSGNVYIRYKGTDEYFPCEISDAYSIGSYIASEKQNDGSYQLTEGVTVTVKTTEVAYTGAPVLPEVEVTIQNANLMNGQKVTLVKDRDFIMEPVSEEDWQVGEGRQAYLRFQGNYSQDTVSYPNPGGYLVTFDVIPGALTVGDYPVAVAKGSQGTQTVDLSQLPVTPVQDSYAYTLDIVPDNNILENVTIDGASLTFTLKDGGETGTVRIPVVVESPSAAGSGTVTVTVTAQTSGPVTLKQGEQTFWFDTLAEALTFARDGDTITLSQVMTEDVAIDKAVIIDGGKAGGIQGNVTFAAAAQIRECDLSGAAVSVVAGGEKASLTHNYWNSLNPTPANAAREQLFPLYKDAAMTILVSDPAPLVDKAIKDADSLIYNESENLISLRDIRDKMDEEEVQVFLRSHKDQLQDIIDQLNQSADPDALEVYLEANPDQKELLDLLHLAYDIACKVVPQPSEPTVEADAVQADTEAGKALADAAKADITGSKAVGEYAPVFAGELKTDGLTGVTDVTQAIYLIVDISTQKIQVDERVTPPAIVSLVFDVQAEYAVDNPRGTYQVLPNNTLGGPVTFRLPIPRSVTQRYAKVEHPGDAVRYLDIRTDEETGDQYIQLSVTHFSPFTVTFTDSKPSGGSSSSGGSGSSSYRDGEYDFWMKVKNKIENADAGDTIKVNAKGYDRMPYSVMEALREAGDVTLTVTWNGGKTFTIPAGAALDESSRIYYPLAYLAGYDFGEKGLAVASGSHVNPETGGVLEITAPAAADLLTDADHTASDLGLAAGGGLVEEDLTGADAPATSAQAANNTAEKNLVLPGVLAAAMVILVVGMGFWFWKRRDQE